MQLNITQKLTLAFALFSILVAATIGALAYSSGQAALQGAIFSELLTSAAAKETTLKNWIAERQSDLRVVIDAPDLIDAVAELRRAEPGSNAYQEAHRQTIALLEPRAIGSGFVAVLVLNPTTGQVIASTDATQEGKSKADRSYFSAGQKGPTVQDIYYSSDLQMPTITAALPMLAANGELLAVVAGQLDMAEINGFIAQRSGLYNTDEAYLVNTSNLYVTQPRFLNEAMIFRPAFANEAITRCLTGNNGSLLNTDYRNVPVIGVYRWLSDRQLCLIVKIDQAEAFESTRTFGLTLFELGALALLAAFVIASALSRTITRPVLELQSATMRFGHGYLNVRVSEKRQDELGLLAHEFNAMAQSLAEQEMQLRSNAEHLEQVVEQRTAELRESESRLAGIVASAMDAIITIDSDRRIVLFNAAAQVLFRCTATEAIGRSINHFIPERFHATHTHHVDEFIRRGITNRTSGGVEAIIGLRADGEEFPIEASLSRVHVGDKKLFTIILRDMTERLQTEQALRDSEMHYRSLFENMLNGYAYCKMFFENDVPQDFEYLAVNRAFETLTGLTNVVGKRVTEAIPGIKESNPELFETYGRVARTGKPESFETYVSPLKIWLSISVYSPASGYFVAIFENITERKHSEQALRLSEKRYRLLVDAIPNISLHLFDHDHRFLIAGGEEIAKSGFDKNRIEGRSLVEAYPSEVVRILKPLFDKALRGEATLFEQTYGDYVYHQSIIPVYDEQGNIYAGMALSQNITERKRADAEIRKLNEELEIRVEQRTTELRAANKELEAFSYSVSHDLRAPLRAIDGFSRIVTENYAAQLSKDAQRYLGLVRDNTRQMGRLIDDLLAFSRLNRQSLKRESFKPTDLVRQVLDGLRAEQEGRCVDITLGDLPECEADFALLRQVWVNLISNALKFTRKCEVAKLEIGCRKIEVGLGDECNGSEPLTPSVQPQTSKVYYIRDNGVGFDMAYVDKLFGVFQRLHRPEEYEGTGVGLAIVQRVIHRHGGRVWAESELGKGATFYFTLG